MDQFKMLIINTYERWYTNDYQKTRETYPDFVEVIKKSDVEN